MRSTSGIYWDKVRKAVRTVGAGTTLKFASQHIIDIKIVGVYIAFSQNVNFNPITNVKIQNYILAFSYFYFIQTQYLFRNVSNKPNLIVFSFHLTCVTVTRVEYTTCRHSSIVSQTDSQKVCTESLYRGASCITSERSWPAPWV